MAGTIHLSQWMLYVCWVPVIVAVAAAFVCQRQQGPSSAHRHPADGEELPILSRTSKESKLRNWRSRVMSSISGDSNDGDNDDDWKTELSNLLPVVDSRTSTIHLIVLVHGIMGNPQEMGYLQQTLQEQVNEHDLIKDETTSTVVHSAICNDKRTMDGIATGGRRLAEEIDTIVQHYHSSSSLQRVTLSFVGNSLGGLYARYALGHISSWKPSPSSSMDIQLEPLVFLTTSTPHLGVSRHTYLPIPQAVESMVAVFLQETGRDLFGRPDYSTATESSTVLEDLTFGKRYLEPLLEFSHRIAYANVFGTDFQVPTSTAAFWEFTLSPHRSVSIPKTSHPELDLSKTNIVAQLETPQDLEGLIFRETSMETNGDDNGSSPKEQDRTASTPWSRQLDRLGWTKVLVDVRSQVPGISKLLWKKTPSNMNPLGGSIMNTPSSSTTARDLLATYNELALWKGYFPLGHTVMVANSKDKINQYLTQGGQPTMDYLARDLLDKLLVSSATSTS